MSTATIADTSKPTLSPENTTFIGDAVFTNLAASKNTWLVQIIPHLTCKMLIEMILDDKIKVDKKYIFIAVGSAQLYTIGADDIVHFIDKIVDVVMAINFSSRIYIISAIPRPHDNEQVRPYIVDFNRQISKEVRRKERGYSSISYIAVQNDFLKNRVPDERYYSNDRFTLNAQGCKRFKQLVLEAAGFQKNE